MRKQAKVLKSSWRKIPKYKDYPFVSDVKIESATEEHFPYIEFGRNDAESGNYADVCESHNGGVYIFAKEIPESDIDITVSLFRG